MHARQRQTNRLTGNGDGGGTPKRTKPFILGAVVAKTLLPKRVLVVEDNLDSVHTLAYLLNDMGHSVEYAINGYVALDVAKRFRPDVALLDLGLPGIDGYAVARRLRDDPTGRGLRLVALTGYGLPEDRERALAAGFDAHVVKPVDLEKLRTILAEA